MNTHGQLTFLARDSAAPVYHASAGGAAAQIRLAGSFEEHDVDVIDGRQQPDRFELDVHGFTCVPAPTAVGDLYDEQQRSDVYEDECRTLLSRQTGAHSVHVFDHTLRSADPVRREEKLSREPASVVHNDYTPRSASRRVTDLLACKADSLLKNGFAIVNVWRPLQRVESFPIALCDARSISPDDLVPSERRARDRVGEIYMVHFSSAQRWFYFSALNPDEALLIKTFDSRRDGRARWAVHAAFDDLGGPADARPRESIETRAFAFFKP